MPAPYARARGRYVRGGPATPTDDRLNASARGKNEHVGVPLRPTAHRRAVAISLPSRGGILGFSGTLRNFPPMPASEPETTEIPAYWWEVEEGSHLRPRPCKGRALPAGLSARSHILAL